MTREQLEDLKARGYDWVCLGCNSVYRERPVITYEDGHGGRLMNMCRCGSDLFATIEEVLKTMK